MKCHCYHDRSLEQTSLSTDYGGSTYLLIMDYFSKYPEVCLLQGKSASAVISHFRTVFARHGLPEIMVADNMPYDSSDMIMFATEYGFTINTSRPEHAASNNQSEQMIGTVKLLMRKANEDSRHPNLALLAYRNTPVAGNPYSPPQLLMTGGCATIYEQLSHCSSPELQNTLTPV